MSRDIEYFGHSLVFISQKNMCKVLFDFENANVKTRLSSDWQLFCGNLIRKNNV